MSDIDTNENESNDRNNKTVDISTNSSSKNVKLPYFHRTLSEEDKNLLGDITPKRIDDSTSIKTAVNPTSSLSSASLWNQGTTWEERDCSKWAIDKITTLFNEDIDFHVNDDVDIQILNVSDIKGMCQLTHSRGKPRYLYEYSFNVEIIITETKSNKTFKGTKINIIDAINDQLEDIELEIHWDSKRPSTRVVDTIKSFVSKDFKKFVLKKFKIFEEEFRKL